MKKKLVMLICTTLLSACVVKDTGRNAQEDLVMTQEEKNPNQQINQTQQMALDIPQPANTDATKSSDTNTQEEVLVDLKTSKGIITLKLYKKDAPNTVNNFLDKASSGYYENLTFHRVEDWVIQGGDPKGNGTGGGQMPTELNQQPFKIGSLGVARGPNIEISNDSQFFICTADCSWLTGQYTNFGEVVSGIEVVKSIEIGDTISKINPK